jgi:hypothetical protein
MRKAYTFLFWIMLIFTTLFYSESFSQEMKLKAGVARTDITPAESLYMGGYSGRMGPSDGVHGNLYIRVLVFDDNANRVAFIESDIVGYPRTKYDTIKKQISDEIGIPFDYILLGSVHNHAAPILGGKNEKSEWNKQFKKKLASTIEQAIEDLEPVRIGGGIGSSRIAMNRRKKMKDTFSYVSFDENFASQSFGKYKTDNPVKIRELEGVVRLGANPDGPIDDEVGILRIDDISGEPKAVFVNYACHGTSLGARNNTISPEWNGHMLEYVEKNIPGITGIFAQGAAGDINPRIVGGLDGYQDDHERTAELGHEIGKEVVRVFNTIETAVPLNSQIKLVHKEILCPRKYDTLYYDFKNTTVSVPVTGVRIDNFTWITFPGELFHEIGKTIKRSAHSRYAFLVGYCNGSLGYLTTQKAFSEGGYEPSSSQFAPVAEKIFIKEVKKMLIELF